MLQSQAVQIYHPNEQLASKSLFLSSAEKKGAYTLSSKYLPTYITQTATEMNHTEAVPLLCLMILKPDSCRNSCSVIVTVSSILVPKVLEKPYAA